MSYSPEGMQRLGRAVKRARIQGKHGSLAEFAVQVGVSSKTLSTLEKGRPVSDETIYLVERALGWREGRAEELLLGEPDHPRPQAGEDVVAGSDLDADDRSAIAQAIIDVDKATADQPASLEDVRDRLDAVIREAARAQRLVDHLIATKS